MGEVLSAGYALPKRPLPDANDEFYWEGTRSRHLMLQRCGRCGRLRHPPSPACPACRSLEWMPVAAAGEGSVYSFIVPRYPEFEPFGSGYVVALIDLAEGVRVLANLRGSEAPDITIGAAVTLTWEPLADGYWLPQFKLRQAEEAS
jgi:uncharacterized OB-fold protein